MYWHQKNRITGIFCILIFIVLTRCGPSLFLQKCSISKIADHNRIHIETGRKNSYGEMGVSYFQNLNENKSQLALEKSYDLEKSIESYQSTNTIVHTTGQVFGVYGTIAGKKLAIGMLDIRLGMVNEEPYYDIIAGTGVRLYKGYVAGRALFHVGISNSLNDIHLLEIGNAHDYDYMDHYKKVITSAGVSFNINMNSPKLFLNPFLNTGVRYYDVFKYQNIYLYLLSFSFAAGVYKEIGPFSVAAGLQLERLYNEKESIVHPGILTQWTYLFGDSEQHY
jgi:hypothetical protein